MSGSGDTAEPRYRAFLSYSHRDAAFARRLHRWLEIYRPPKRLIGQPGRFGPVPSRLGPIFRDREELSAADDLSTEVRAALTRSDALIVICSPAAAASPWVAREITTFRSLHPDRPVLAAVTTGEPSEAFPHALLTSGVEPLAADFRRGRDGHRLALLKLAAGVAGCGLDELVQRDAQRRVARVTAVTVAALTAMLAMGLTTIVALDARKEAESQRAKAQDLVDFMQTDLREQLRGVGRLDVMASVNERALAHYKAGGRLSSRDQQRQARILLAIGEDDELRARKLLDDVARARLLSLARARFQQAHDTTKRLLADLPDDPERIFTHAQSLYWLALNDLDAGRIDAARQGFKAYHVQAERLTRLSPRDPLYRREVGYALGNLCTVDLQAPIDADAAVRHCEAALREIETARDMGLKRPVGQDLVNRHGWLADAYRKAGRPDQAMAHRLAEERILDPLIQADPLNLDLRQSWLTLQRALAALEYGQGRKPDAKARLVRALDVARLMAAFNPQNSEWSALEIEIKNNIEYVEKH